jgi:ubiquinone/menaquinone biosynthesis C-methylase UbiE
MPKARSRKPEADEVQGWRGWDDYAPFYDWENAQTLDRRDVGFWRRLAQRANGRVLELGCGTGRVTLPVSRAGPRVVGVDRSEAMLAKARRRARRAGVHGRLSLVRGDIRTLPFARRARFKLVMAPYGVLQSLVRDADLAATLSSVAGVLARRGVFGIDLVPDLPVWQEYRDRVRFKGRRRGGRSRITLVESVRQDRRRGLTIFDERYVEQRDGRRRTREFSLVFRTISVPEMTRRLERAGLRVTAVLGDYDGRPWDARADVWVILAERAREVRPKPNTTKRRKAAERHEKSRR